MDSDIKAFSEEITENTGIKFAVYDTSGVFFAGHAVPFDKFPTELDGLFSSVKNNATFFRLRFRSKNYTGVIAGSGKVEKNYAYLIAGLAEKDYSKNLSLSREEFFKAVLFGEASYYQINKFMRKFSITDRPGCVMIVTALNGKAEDVINVLANYGADSSAFVFELDEEQCVLLKFCDEVNGEYSSVTEYAEFLSQSVYEEIGVTVFIALGGTVGTVSDLATSFSQASYVRKMSKFLGAQSGVHSFKEYMLVRMLEDLPKYKLNEYLGLLLDDKAREVFNDAEMIDTAEEFLEANLNVSETSRKIYLHRNTLMYRLDKIEKATGLNIRKFSDALTFRLITYLCKLVR